MTRRSLPVAAVCSIALALSVSPAASARDGSIRSFDGTRIVYSFFPAEGLEPGERAPTVMYGPGYSQARETDPDASSEDLFGSVGTGPLRRAGFNVLTWDPRGFGDSEGMYGADGPTPEGRDAQALVDLIATQPEAQLDGPGDPRLGMSGVSYGGGIQLVLAGMDTRVDVITPVIAWHSLVTSLYKNQTPKGGWGAVLFGAGAAGGATGGTVGGLQGDPNGFVAPRTGDPHITSAFTSGLATGTFPDEDVAWFASRGPAELVGRIRIPTLLVEGTADTLFTLHEAIVNHGILRPNVPVKMVWFCGGHGVCLTGRNPDRYVENAVIAWLRHHLKGETDVDTGPRFRWVADDGVVRHAGSYPPPLGEPLTGSGSGTLPLAVGDTSGALIAAAPAANAVNVPLQAPQGPLDLVGEPQLELTYTGSGAPVDDRIYAQIVDNKRGIVLGNQVTPIRIALDGQPHTISLPLEGVAAHADKGSSYTLQILGGSNVYFAQRSAGAVQLSSIRVSIPTVASGGARAVGSARRLSVAVSPRQVRVGERRRFRFRVTTRDSAGQHAGVTQAVVRFAGRRYRTDSRGYAVARHALRRARRYEVRASKSGYSSARAGVRAVRGARRAPRFTG